jgi:hypothetical protein
MPRIGLKSEPVALSAETVDKLIERGSGDAALLYLYLLRTGGDYVPKTAQESLGWNAAKVMSAFTHLVELGLAEDNTPPERKNTPKPEDCPAYTTDDIASELSADGSDFKALLEEVEHLLGKKCSVTDLRILLELYDHLAMPAEVLLLLTAHLIEETQHKYGPGRRPRMGEIKARAYQWKKNGIDTLESADAYLKKLDYLKSREGALLSAVGITGREAIEGEKRFLHQWTEWGFGPEAVRLAYERTMLRTGAMKWPYCNGILRRWNDKNAHTPEEIEAVERGNSGSGNGNKRQPAASNGANGEGISVPKNARKNAEWMRRMLAEDDRND